MTRDIIYWKVLQSHNETLWGFVMREIWNETLSVCRRFCHDCHRFYVERNFFHPTKVEIITWLFSREFANVLHIYDFIQYNKRLGSSCVCHMTIREEDERGTTDYSYLDIRVEDICYQMQLSDPMIEELKNINSWRVWFYTSERIQTTYTFDGRL